MVIYKIKAYSLCNEINLDKISSHFGINKKYKWEESLTLKDNLLSGILKETDNRIVEIFHYGSIVFINLEYHEIMDVVNYLQKVEKNLSNVEYKYSDDYELEVSEHNPEINYEKMIVGIFNSYQLDILSTVLAKSVALEKIEDDIEILLDNIESVVELLKINKLKIRDKKIAEISAKILGYKYNTISYILLLDKPDITWVNQDAAELYASLAHIFELDERYNKINIKSEILMEIMKVFSSIIYERRGHRLELIVIILIAFEIIFSLVQYIFNI